MNVPIRIVDAFAERPFEGNPAAVCLLERDADEAWMAALAREMNLSETAFVAPHDEGWGLRWFTPVTEVDLCGHATLASAHVLWEEGRADPAGPIRFDTRGGVVTATRREREIEIDLPAAVPVPGPTPPGLAESIGLEASYVGRSPLGDHVLEAADEGAVRSADPDLVRLARVAGRGTILTAVADDPVLDFVSRFFAPAVGVDEDPVTGSAFCALGPFWADRLGRDELVGHQASARGGIVRVTVRGDRVGVAGCAVTVLQGEVVGPPQAVPRSARP